MSDVSKPLSGVRVIEFGSIGPGPFAAMMLADHGAEVVRITRPGPQMPGHGVLLRGRARTVELDLKSDSGREAARALCADADALIEGNRPGVMERLGLGPDALAGLNPRLVYGRMTGWGQTGPLAQQVGHDINYLAVAGALHAFGRAEERPAPPLNLVADFGGGAMMLAFGLLAAILRARETGQGCVVDAAMTDGTAMLTAMMWSGRNEGSWSDARGANLLDTGAPFYDVYEAQDGRWMAVGAIEPQFYAALLRGLGLDADPALARQEDRAAWQAQKQRIAARFRERAGAEWAAVFAGTDSCVTLVPTPDEAVAHPHNVARGTFLRDGRLVEPAPAPRYAAPAADRGRPGGGSPGLSPPPRPAPPPARRSAPATARRGSRSPPS